MTEKSIVEEVEGAERASRLEEEPRPKIHLKTFMIVFAMCAVQFSLLIQLVAAGVFASDIAAVIGGANISPWMFTAITITFVVFAPPIGQAADYWGRRWFLVVLCLFGFAGTLICSLSTSMEMAIAGEVLVGVCFASTPLTLAVTSEVLPHRLRLTGQAAIGIANNLGAIFALLVGGALIKTRGPEGFRILYYINAALFLVTAIVTWWFYNPPPRDLQVSLTTREKLAKLDWIGYGLLLVAAVFLVMGLSWAQNPYPWRDARVYVPIVIGGVFLVALVIYSWKIKKDGLIHHGLFSRDRNCALAFVGVFCEGMIFGELSNVFISLQQSTVYGSSAWKISLVYTTAVLVSCAIAPVAAVISYRYKQIQWLSIGGFVSFLIFSITIATSTATGTAAFWGYQVFLGCGLTLTVYALVSAAQLSAPPELISVTSGLFSSIRSLGVTIAVAIGVAIFNGQLSKLLPEKVIAAATGEGLAVSEVPQLLGDLVSGNTTNLANIHGITPSILEASVSAMKLAYLESFHAVWYAGAAFSAVGIIAAMFTFNPVEDLNNRIDAPVETPEELYG